MVLEVLIIGGVIYYYAHKRNEKKKARLAEAAAANAGSPSNQQYSSSSPQNKGEAYSDLPSYGDARRQGPPVYEDGTGGLPGYTDRQPIVNEKAPVLNVNEQSR
jgi:hypothetical protein